jgi:hypothetical protein
MKTETALLPGERCDSNWCEVRRSGIHGRGLFAKRRIPQGTRIIEYIGELIDKKESDRRAWARIDYAKKTGDAAVYIFTLNKKFDIDGDVPWNSARLINHSCDPNCESYIEDDHIWIAAKRDIAKGEELYYNYGFDLETWEEHPCLCGAPRCVGYIAGEKYWPKLKTLVARRAAAVKAEIEKAAKKRSAKKGTDNAAKKPVKSPVGTKKAKPSAKKTAKSGKVAKRKSA